VSVVRGSERW